MLINWCEIICWGFNAFFFLISIFLVVFMQKYFDALWGFWEEMSFFYGSYLLYWAFAY